MRDAHTSGKTRLAVFDFDGTVIQGQSGALISRYLFARRRISPLRALRLSWWGTRYLFHLPYRQAEARELVFGGLNESDQEAVDATLREFHDEVLLPRYRRKAVEEIARRKREGCVTLLVSATFAPIASIAATRLGCDNSVATEMEVDLLGNYTGRVEGLVIAGANKLTAVQEWADEQYGSGEWELAYAYGDHYTDEPLLAFAGEAFAVCPGKALKSCARRNGWAILDWSEKATTKG